MTILADDLPGELDPADSLMDQLAEPAPGDGLACPDCPETFTGRTAAARRTLHMRKHHGHGAPAAEKAPKSKKAKGGPGSRMGGASSERSPAPGKTARRVGLDKLAGLFCQFAAKGIDSTGAYPTARALVMETPILAGAIDDALKGTLMDRALQPVARSVDKGSAIVAMLMFPTAIHAMHVNPNSAPMMVPIARECLSEMLPLMAKQIEKQAREERDNAQILESMRDALGVPSDQPVTIDHVLQQLFIPPDVLSGRVEE